MKFKVWDKKRQRYWDEEFTPINLGKSRKFPDNAESYFEIQFTHHQLMFETTGEGDFVANLGRGEVARLVAKLMVALFGGYTIRKKDGSYLYFNDACDADGYRNLYDKVMSND